MTFGSFDLLADKQARLDYVTRRTAEGLSKRDIIRCLKRDIIREVYHPIVPSKNVTRIAS